MPTSLCSISVADAWDQSKNPSSRDSLPEIDSFLRGHRSSSYACGTWLRGCGVRRTLVARFRDAYKDEKLVCTVDDPPWVSRIAGKHHAEIGGFAMSADGKRVVIVATLDNLLKGAATQAMQNINRALCIDEYTAIPT